MGTDKIVNITNKLDNLRLLLIEFRNSDFYRGNYHFYRSIIPNMEIAIALTDKGITDKRAIQKDEEFWFKGDRFISEAFNLRGDVKPYEIYLHYKEICSYVFNENYFR